MTHRQKITDEQRLKLLSLLMETNWQKIEKRQVKDNAPDDYPDFDFTIQIHNRLFKYNVYLTRVDQLLELANYLNSILPKQFSIDYTDEYIGYAK